MLDTVPKGYLLAIFTLATSFTAIHCSSSRDSFQPEPKDDSPVVTFVDATTAEVDVTEPLSDCADENKLIYVLSQGEKRLYRFDPEALTFSSIGNIRCPTSSNTISMAVDRRGTAWVEYKDGRIFKVSTNDASCTPTTYRRGPLQQIQQFGMGFAKDDNEAGAPLSETLYLAGNLLGRLDLSTLEVSIVGSGAGYGELTGTGAGKLYAFPATGDRIVRLDKTTGTTLETYRPAVRSGGGFAFAHWGGDFWIFTAPDGRSIVTRYSPSTDTAKVVVEDTGMEIIGAGSSTCAPYEPPH